MNDVTVQILCVAAVISLGIGAGIRKHREEYGYLEGIAIVAVVRPGWCHHPKVIWSLMFFAPRCYLALPPFEFFLRKNNLAGI